MAKAARRTQELLGELLLSEVRQLTGKSQQQVADVLGIKQPSLSKLEKQADMHISTLQKIVAALAASWRFWRNSQREQSGSISSIGRTLGRDIVGRAIYTLCEEKWISPIGKCFFVVEGLSRTAA